MAPSVRECRRQRLMIAAQGADELLAAGDVDGQAIWKLILRAVEELQRTESVTGARLN